MPTFTTTTQTNCEGNEMRPITVKNGIAAVEPDIMDFDVFASLNDNTAWLELSQAIEQAEAVLNHFGCGNPPGMRDRWTLYQTLRKIRRGADALEGHMAANALWISEDEFEECEMYQVGTVWPGFPRAI